MFGGTYYVCYAERPSWMRALRMHSGLQAGGWLREVLRDPEWLDPRPPPVPASRPPLKVARWLALVCRTRG